MNLNMQMVYLSEGEIENDPTVQDGALCGQNFEEIRQECLDNGELFTDPEFPPDDQSLFYSKDPPFAFEWKRASEISETACLIEGMLCNNHASYR